MSNPEKCDEQTISLLTVRIVPIIPVYLRGTMEVDPGLETPHRDKERRSMGGGNGAYLQVDAVVHIVCGVDGSRGRGRRGSGRVDRALPGGRIVSCMAWHEASAQKATAVCINKAGPVVPYQTRAAPGPNLGVAPILV